MAPFFLKGSYHQHVMLVAEMEGIPKPMGSAVYFDGYMSIFLGKTASRYPHPVETAQTKG